MWILDQIESHILLNASIRDVICAVNPYSRMYDRAISRLTKIDPIRDYGAFCELMRSVKRNKHVTLLRFGKFGSESRFYGYYTELLRYAGCERDRIVYIPAMEHGVRFSSQPWFERRGRLLAAISCSCQGPGRAPELYELDPWKPLFILGPYIHYASAYYTPEETRRLKKELGRTLLVFPSHSVEMIGNSSDMRSFFDTVYRKYAPDYDSILVCSYWHDMDSPVLDDFAKNGARLVSAGFRDDQLFVRRLKTIISLADDVVVDDLGTNIGFCRYLGKRVFFECSEPRFPDDPLFVSYFRQFRGAFFSPDRTFTEEQKKKQEELYRSFWGGEEYLRAPDEVSDILSVLKEMCTAVGYNVNKMPEYIRRTCPANRAQRRYRLLAEAVSPAAGKQLLGE